MMHMHTCTDIYTVYTHIHTRTHTHAHASGRVRSYLVYAMMSCGNHWVRTENSSTNRCSATGDKASIGKCLLPNRLPRGKSQITLLRIEYIHNEYYVSLVSRGVFSLSATPCDRTTSVMNGQLSNQMYNYVCVCVGVCVCVCVRARVHMRMCILSYSKHFQRCLESER